MLRIRLKLTARDSKSGVSRTAASASARACTSTGSSSEAASTAFVTSFANPPAWASQYRSRSSRNSRNWLAFSPGRAISTSRSRASGRLPSTTIRIAPYAARRNASGSLEPVGIKSTRNMPPKVANLSARDASLPAGPRGNGPAPIGK